MKFFLLIFSAAVLGGCSMTKVKVDPQGLGQAKKVAIVGFHLLVEEPKSIMGDINKIKDLAHGKVDGANQESDAADQLYGDLATRLSREMNWQVKSAADVRANALYKQLVVQYTTGLQIGGTPHGENMHQLRPHGILDSEPLISKISQGKREELMDALGVNALVGDFVIATLKNESSLGGMIGRAKYKPHTQNIIRVYVRGKKGPVWFDTWAWGDGDEAIQASANYISDEALLKQVRISSEKSFEETFKRYKAL
jgi:hypothetical protein